MQDGQNLNLVPANAIDQKKRRAGNCKLASASDSSLAADLGKTRQTFRALEDAPHCLDGSRWIVNVCIVSDLFQAAEGTREPKYIQRVSRS